MNQTLTQILKAIKPLDRAAMEAARRRQNTLTKPQGSLGRLEELATKIAGIKGEPLPKLERKAIVTMAADHGVVAEGVSAYPQEVTKQMVCNFLDGGAGINVLAQHIGARVIVVNMGMVYGFEPHPGLICKMIDFGTGNIARGPAMTRQQAVDTITAGIEIIDAEVAKGLDIIGTGDMGIGNTTASSAICAAITGEPVEEFTGRGTGIDDEQLAYKIEVVRQALVVNQPEAKDPLDVLAKVGGFEIGGIAGVILGAAAHHIPVVLDGFISGASALIAAELSPPARDYFIAAHVSAEAGHRRVLQYLGLAPLLDLKMRLGEGTGAALGIFLAEAAVKALTQMATFTEARVSEKKVSVSKIE